MKPPVLVQTHQCWQCVYCRLLYDCIVCLRKHTNPLTGIGVLYFFSGANMKKNTALSVRTVLRLCAYAAAAVLLCACGGRPERETAAARESVVIAIGTEPETLDPTRGWGHGNSPIVQSTLVRYTAALEFENDLAREYGLSDDGLVWTFTIRDDAYFSDGEKVTAADVAFTLETAKAAQSAVDLSYMESARAVNDTTVVITLTEPTSVFLNTLASVGIVPEHAYSENYGRHPIGSGPYKFVEWRPQEQLVFEANERYYGELPAIKRVVIVFMAEDAALAAVQAGAVDAAYSSATLGAVQVDGYHVEAIPSVDNRGFTLPLLANEGKKTADGAVIGNNVTCHTEIRQAIAYAIDRELIADTVLNGFARPAYSENDGMPWNNAQTVIETDVPYARQLLMDAGWRDSDGDGIVEKNGTAAEFSCLYPAGDSVRQAVALAAAEQVQRIGIKIMVEGTSWDDITRRMFSEAVMMGWGSSSPNETFYLYRSEGAFRTDFYNPEGYMSAVTDSYLAAAMQALTVEEANRNWQKVQWDGAAGTAMRGVCPWVWIVNLDHVTFVRDGLSIGEQPLHGHGHGLSLIQNLHEWEWQL